MRITILLTICLVNLVSVAIIVDDADTSGLFRVVLVGFVAIGTMLLAAGMVLDHRMRAAERVADLPPCTYGECADPYCRDKNGDCREYK